MELPVKISTITATGSVGAAIDLRTFFESVDVNDRVTYVEYGSRKSGCYVFKGSCRKKSRKEKQFLRRFDNQVTLVFRINDISQSVNLKVFSNGNIQITGIKEIEQGRRCIQDVIDMVKMTPGCVRENTMLGSPLNYRIHMINSNFSMGFLLSRERFFKHMRTNLPLHICSYEPCIYPGVKISYMHNIIQDPKGQYMQRGICTCDIPSRGKRENLRAKQCALCAKITIAVFQSGSVIITGATEYEHLRIAHTFIHAVLQDARSTIERKLIM